MQYLRAKQTAVYLNRSLSHVWFLVKAKELTTIKLRPRVTVFSVEMLENYVASKGGLK